MKTITIVADDRVGLVADISYILSKSKLNIESINVDVVAGKAIITLSIADIVKAKEALESSGYKAEEINAVIVKLPDQPGELNNVTALLSKEKINILNLHMLSKDGRFTVLSLNVDKPKRASKLLEKYLISNETML
ncbi:hypothetical protein HY990_01255 [Candidatus Micrarchaeota archaeon]|nr:hypothetical protein [Candidatus Micrarchaeota archaeon]